MSLFYPFFLNTMSILNKRKFELDFPTVMNSPRWVGELDSPATSCKKSSPTSGSFQEATLRQESSSYNSQYNNARSMNRGMIGDLMMAGKVDDSLAMEEAMDFESENVSHPLQYQHHIHPPTLTAYSYPMDSNPFAGIAPEQTYAPLPVDHTTTTTALWRTGYSSDMPQPLQSGPNYHQSQQQSYQQGYSFISDPSENA